MPSQSGITCVLCLTAVSIQQCYCVCFYRALSESDKLLVEKNLWSNICLSVCGDKSSISKGHLRKESISNFVSNLEKQQRRL